MQEKGIDGKDQSCGKGLEQAGRPATDLETERPRKREPQVEGGRAPKRQEHTRFA